jgi:hypothetical protein
MSFSHLGCTVDGTIERTASAMAGLRMGGVIHIGVGVQDNTVG